MISLYFVTFGQIEMKKNRSDIREKLQWAKERLRSPKLGRVSKQRCLVYISAMLLLLGRSQKMSAETYSGSSEEMPRTEMRAAISNNSDIAETNIADKNIFTMTNEEVLKHFDITELSLSELCLSKPNKKFSFTAEELQAMKPGPLARKLVQRAKAEAWGKNCKGKCYKSGKNVMFSPIVRKQLLQVDNSYVPQQRWGSLSAYMGKEEMEALPQFVGCELPHENIKDVPDGTVLIFMPSKKHPHGHFAYKYDKYLLSDGQEVIANIPEDKYSGVVAFFPVDNVISTSEATHSQNLADYSAYLKFKNADLGSMQTTLLTDAVISSLPPQSLVIRD